MAGREPPGDVRHRAEAGHRRPRGDPRLRRARRGRAAPDRALPADGRRHPRHQPQGVERLEGEAARGPLLVDAQAPRRRPRYSVATSLQARQDEARAKLRLYAVPENAQEKLWTQLDDRLLPAPRAAGDRLAHAAPLLPRRHADAGRQGAALAGRRRPAGDDLRARPEGALRAHLQLLRAHQLRHLRGEDLHDARTATRSTASRSRTPTTAGRSTATSSASSSTSSPSGCC